MASIGERKRSIHELQKILEKFRASGYSELTPCCDLEEYIGSVQIHETDQMSLGYCLKTTRPVEKGEIVLISRAVASCVREYLIECREPDEKPKTFVGQPLVLDSDTDSSGSAKDDDSSVNSDDEELREANDHRVPAEVSEQLTRGIEEWLTTSTRAFQIIGLQNNLLKRDGKISQAHLGASSYSYKMRFPEQVELAAYEELLTIVPKQMRLLPGVIARNASYDDVKWQEETTSGESEYREKDAEFWGLWLLPSFINHSCVPNCTRERVGSYLIVRASANLDKSEMLTLPYFNIFKPLSIRDKSSKAWGLRCCCSRCTIERECYSPNLLKIESRFIRMYHQFERSCRIPAVHQESDSSSTLDLMRDMAGLTVEIDRELETMAAQKAAHFHELPTEQEHQQKAGGSAKLKSDAERRPEPGPEQSNGGMLKGNLGNGIDPSEYCTSDAERRSKYPNGGILQRTVGNGIHELSAERSPEHSNGGIPQGTLGNGTNESEHVECSKAEMKTRRAAKRKKKKVEKKEKKKAEEENGIGRNSGMVREKRLFIKDDALRKDVEAAEEFVRLLYVRVARGAAENAELEAVVQNWGDMGANPFDKIWRIVDLDFLERDFQRDPLPYYIKASYIDVDIATHSWSTVIAACLTDNGDNIVMLISDVVVLLDMLNTISVVSGCAALADELVLHLRSNFQVLLWTLPKGASVLIHQIMEKFQSRRHLPARISCGF